MKPIRLLTMLVLLSAAPGWTGAGQDGPSADSSPRRFTPDGYSSDPAFFPIAVWLQHPSNAARFMSAGINLYVGLWKGPTPEQLEQLACAGMPVICEQNAFGLTQVRNPIIAGWMHGDEPDNAQPLPDGNGYGPPIPPDVIVRDYERIRNADPSRPVLLNLGQGVAWDAWIGRGVRRNRPEDYPEYLQGCDIASFDIYPVVHDSPDVAGKLEFVARGVERLVQWTHGNKPVWSCIECTRIGNPAVKATPDQVRAEVWMALVRGARGIIYFVHQFKPSFREAALLDDPEMLAAVTEINRQVRELAPVLNSPDLDNPGVTVASSGGAEIAILPRRHQGILHLFAVNLRNKPGTATFDLSAAPPATAAEVLYEARRIAVRDGVFTDAFDPYGVHLYRLSPGTPSTPAREVIGGSDRDRTGDGIDVP